jgi:metallo-beta-lactamase class B
MKKDLKNQKITSFRIFGNLYYVGTRSGPSHLIDTGNGLILLDTGYPQTLHLLVQSMWELGFDPRNIKFIVHSHGHYDHIGNNDMEGKYIKMQSGGPNPFINPQEWGQFLEQRKKILLDMIEQEKCV